MHWATCEDYLQHTLHTKSPPYKRQVECSILRWLWSVQELRLQKDCWSCTTRSGDRISTPFFRSFFTRVDLSCSHSKYGLLADCLMIAFRNRFLSFSLVGSRSFKVNTGRVSSCTTICSISGGCCAGLRTIVAYTFLMVHFCTSNVDGSFCESLLIIGWRIRVNHLTACEQRWSMWYCFLIFQSPYSPIQRFDCVYIACLHQQ